MDIRDDKYCQTCIFYKMCVAAKLDHCEGEDYFADKKEETK